VQSWRDQLKHTEIIEFLLNLKPNQTVKLESTKAQEQIRTVVETLNLVEVADLILCSALFRTESRGGHYRRDYPTTSPTWQFHTLVQKAGERDGSEVTIGKSAKFSEDLKPQEMAK
jgi:L-aspartate oxidase